MPNCIDCKHFSMNNTDYAAYRLTNDNKQKIRFKCAGGFLLGTKTCYNIIKGFGPNDNLRINHFDKCDYEHK